MELIIISGLSGSGKSVALRALEDSGYYCVDNIPLQLVENLTQLLTDNRQPIAISLDIRNIPNNSEISLEETIQRIEAKTNLRIIYLDCEHSTLIRRYSDTRRIHPLSLQDIPLEEAVEIERKRLEPLFQQANFVIDTSEISTHELSEKIRLFLLGKSSKELQITFESFGYKYGLPLDANYVFDVRFLPNPHWEPNLRPLTGLDEPIIEFLNRHNDVHNFIYTTRNYIETWLPMLEQNNRSYLTIAIGCTGGKHRSVYVAQQLGEYFKARYNNVKIEHRSLSHYKK